MAHGDWLLFAAFIVSLTVLGFGLTCLLWAEKRQRDNLGWINPTQNGRYLQIIGWLGICAGIPLSIIFVQEWFETWFI